MANETMDRIAKRSVAQHSPQPCQRNMNLAQRRLLRFGLALLAFVAVALLAGCREDMHNQPKFIPLRENTFYPDLRSARPIPLGTVARGQYEDDDPLLYTGKIDGKEADQFPFPITKDDLARGRERFNIYCSPCHSRLGDGNGMIVQRGFKRPPSFLDPRLLKAPVGHFINVETKGWGSMADYAAQVPVVDRWRIAAYIRALQLAQTAKQSDVPAGMQVSTQPPKMVQMSIAQPEPGATAGVSQQNPAPQADVPHTSAPNTEAK